MGDPGSEFANLAAQDPVFARVAGVRDDVPGLAPGFVSKTATWHKKGTGNYFRNINGGNGDWIVIAWERSGGGYEKIGETWLFIVG